MGEMPYKLLTFLKDIGMINSILYLIFSFSLSAHTYIALLL